MANFLAVLTVALCFWLGGTYLQGYQPAWNAYVCIIAIMAIIFGFNIVLKCRKALPTWRKFILVFLCSSALLLFSLAAYSVKVINQAKSVAAEAPYCIQVSSSSLEGAEYRATDALLALSPLTMRANTENGMSMNFHALLMVKTLDGPRLYNWSYDNGKFIEYPKPQY